MIGLLLLIIAICLFFFEKYRYISYFLYMGFMLGYGGGFGIWTDQITGIKNMDCAVIYTVIINLYYLYIKEWELPRFAFVRSYVAILIFIIFCAFFSLFHYHLSVFQVIQGGRYYIVLLSLPIFWKCTRVEFIKVLKLLFYVCIITSVLYIPQVFWGHNLLPYDGEGTIDKTIELYRFYNFPANLEIFMCLVFLYPKLFGYNYTGFFKILFILTLVCTLGRSMIIVSLITLFVTLYINNRNTRSIKQYALIIVLMIPLFSVISDRFIESGTDTDIQMLLDGGFGDDYYPQSGATMTYRIAWCYERADYLSGRPLGEKIFGLGMCSDSQAWTNDKYDFIIGLAYEDGRVAQLSTPDIAYGNLISKFGFGGSVLYIMFLLHLAFFFWKRRHCNRIVSVFSVSLFTAFLLAFSGSTFSDPQFFAMPFFVLSLFNRKNDLIHSSSTSKII